MSVTTAPRSVEYDSRHSLIGHCPLTDAVVRSGFVEALLGGRYEEATAIARTHRDKLEDQPVVLEGMDAVRFQVLLGNLAANAPQIPVSVLAHG